MVRRSCFALLACLGLALAGCQNAEPKPEPQPESTVPNNVDGQKVLDALTSSLQKAVTSPEVMAPNQPGEGAEGSAAPPAMQP